MRMPHQKVVSVMCGKAMEKELDLCTYEMTGLLKPLLYKNQWKKYPQ